ncbi:MAG: Holliday junction branch migration DNA helicase RuvB [Planctomycetota bacterium]|jgi:Holliday junction DNA helicase RuvB|nr:Holliday junction branch migration DNA helicase RuvB [Planctomycetota bacterium]MDP6519935.1 Holliday junction branch migration DNA helicase RuvB [Planctomycetota bacterium]MDP6838724.1 Holliday junction branch migration DNA helicase RuvB [Planctomycetota bacterium]
MEGHNESVFHPEALAGADLGPDEREQSPPETRPDQESLRPASLGAFLGQPRVVENLRVALTAAKGRGEPADHILFSGPPGLGKTSLARILAHELGSTLHSTTGPALERPRDLVGILTQLGPRDVLFIDEIHRVPAAVEEYLYTAMEDYSIDFTLDTGPHARILPLSLEPFTLVGATTREGLLSAPFRARFGLFERLRPYPTEDLLRIAMRTASLLAVELTEDGARYLAERCRGTPRVVNRFMRRARDLAQVQGADAIDKDFARGALERLGVDEWGLEEMDRQILRCLAQTPNEAVGLKTIAATVGESEDTLEEVFEPHLLRCGFLRKTARGRMITAAGCERVGAPPPTESSDSSGELFT